jgi:hypothetical protein
MMNDESGRMNYELFIIFRHSSFLLSLNPADNNPLDEVTLSHKEDNDTGNYDHQGSGHIPMPGRPPKGRSEHRQTQRRSKQLVII